MKGCPICCGKFFDDMYVCAKCGIQLMDSEIAKELHYFFNEGCTNEKIIKKYPKESSIVLDYKNNLQPVSNDVSTITIKVQPRSHQPQQQNIPKCPICGSTNLSKITIAQKAGKIALLGIFGMGDNGKTWKCNNCGSKF